MFAWFKMKATLGSTVESYEDKMYKQMNQGMNEWIYSSISWITSQSVTQQFCFIGLTGIYHRPITWNRSQEIFISPSVWSVKPIGPLEKRQTALDIRKSHSLSAYGWCQHACYAGQQSEAEPSKETLPNHGESNEKEAGWKRWDMIMNINFRLHDSPGLAFTKSPNRKGHGKVTRDLKNMMCQVSFYVAF